MDRCVECGGNMEPKGVQARSMNVGLPDVVVDGVVVRQCADCGCEALQYPPLDEVLGAIVRVLQHRADVEGRDLDGPQVRYLRKYLGWSQEDFARVFRVAVTTPSKWENGHWKMEKFKQAMLLQLALRGPIVDDYFATDSDAARDGNLRVMLGNDAEALRNDSAVDDTPKLVSARRSYGQ